MKIGKREIAIDKEPYFIADIAANHDGQLERAFKLIELAKEAGADAAKFQNFKAETIVSKKGFSKIPQLSHQAEWKKSVYEVYEDVSISEEWTSRLKEKCDEVEIEYMTSPYDFKSVDVVNDYVSAYKIGSGDITWTKILEYIARKGKPVLLATGASNITDVERAFSVIRQYTKDIVLMQCNTNYTAEPINMKYINLNVLKTYQTRYPNCILGLSDHTIGNTSVLGALALGARVFEKHFTDDNNHEGPDHKFSMNPKTWREMVNAALELFYAMGDGIKKVEENEKESRIVQQRALYTVRDMKMGEILKESDIYPLRPLQSDCLYPYDMECIIGRELKKDIGADECLTWEVIGDAKW